MPSSTYFSRAFEPVGAVAVLDEYAHDGVGHLGGVLRPHHDAGFAAKSLWPVMPPSASRNQMPGSTPKPSFTSTAGNAMSLVSSSTGDFAGAVEGDVELARQAVQRAVVQDVDSAIRGHKARVSISSSGSMPAVGVPVTLRMLSAPEPREHRPRS